jgi:hypothetical protein
MYIILVIAHNNLCYLHCRQRAPVENVPSASGTSHLGMIDIQATTKSKYYDHIQSDSRLDNGVFSNDLSHIFVQESDTF